MWMAIAYIVLGILLVVGGINGAQAIVGTILTIYGVICIVEGIIFMTVFHSLPVSIFWIVVGVLLVSFAWTIAWIAFLVIGIYMLVNSIRSLCTNHTIVSSIIGILCGLFIILIGCGVNWAWDFGNVLFYVGGALMIAEGIVMLVRLPK